MAIDAGAKMENLGHTKMMHDFDSGLMYEEPFLYVNMEGKRFCNEDTGFVYMGNITKYVPKFNGNNVDANHPDGSLGWYCQIYDSDYMSYANGPIPEQVMTKYIPGAVENPQGVFTNLIDTYKADTIEELAGLLGVPADELQKTIDRYNELSSCRRPSTATTSCATRALTWISVRRALTCTRSSPLPSGASASTSACPPSTAV